MSAARTDHADGERIGQAELRSATERLERIDVRRRAHRLHEHGRSEAEIAAIVGRSVPQVHRIVRGVEECGDEVRPEEVILRAAVDGTDREVLVATLSGWAYTFTEFPPGLLVDGSKPGTWIDVTVANSMGLLGDDEFTRICEAVQPPPIS